ncbi:MAG: hypothetical protein EZS28_041317 [Streblomastix strix]|uniref:Uncharacterized protein n=1 Tax=Streblomastix strix TaxID=222440 RepID=A0A5J4TXD2_9EUKA|nr:MAG: hypothetical protein EZS28_041317 [Streblomastix strix]
MSNLHPNDLKDEETSKEQSLEEEPNNAIIKLDLQIAIDSKSDNNESEKFVAFELIGFQFYANVIYIAYILEYSIIIYIEPPFAENPRNGKLFDYVRIIYIGKFNIF